MSSVPILLKAEIWGVTTSGIPRVNFFKRRDKGHSLTSTQSRLPPGVPCSAGIVFNECERETDPTGDRDHIEALVLAFCQSLCTSLCAQVSILTSPGSAVAKSRTNILWIHFVYVSTPFPKIWAPISRFFKGCFLGTLPFELKMRIT